MFKKGYVPWNKGKKRSKKTKEKISDSHKGKHHTIKTRRKMSKTHKGKQQSKETKKKIKKANIKFFKNHPESRRKENNGFYNKQHTEKSKQKMRRNLPNRSGKNNANFGNHKLKGHKLTPEQCEKIRRNKLGNKYNLGHKHSNKSKQKMRKTLRKHHIYLIENSDKVMLLPVGKHIQLHNRAYHYLYYKYGKKGINNYIKWFDKKYGLKERSQE